MTDMLPYLHEDELTLVALSTAAGCARIFVRHDLREWGNACDIIATAELLTSELVTNAVKMTGITEPHPLYGKVYDDLRLIDIRLRLFVSSLVIEVWDSSPEPPTPQAPNLDAESGRGLLLVESMSARWGYDHPRRGGKVVWCELPVISALDDMQGLPNPLPKRKRSNWLPQPIEAVNDPEVLRQILESLQASDDEGQGK